MKKKHFLTCIALLCVLVVACVIFAACDKGETPPETGFKVTLNFDSNKGSVTLSKPAEGELYDADEEVTVTVTPNEGWLLDAFTVSGFDDAALNEGGYTFKIQADTTVTATFKNDPEFLFASLQGSVRFVGTRVEKDYLEETEESADFNIIFDATKKAVLFESFEGAEPLRLWLYQADKEGNAVELYHDMQGNLQRNPHSNEPLSFSELDNPFNNLTSECLKHVEANKWTLDIDDQAYYDILNALVAYPSYVESFTLYEENGVFVRLECALARMTYEPYEDMQYFFDLDIKEHGTAAITDEEYFGNYILTDGHATLKQAMEKASQAKNYTVKYQTENEEYTLYYTENGIYIDEEGNARGYVPRPDGNLWKYFYDPDDSSFEFDSTLDKYKSVEDLKAFFTLSEADGDDYYIMLKDLGNGKFATRPLDVNVTDGELTNFFAQQLATGEEQVELFYYPYNFSVSLEDDTLHTVEMDCVDFDYKPIHIVLTFENFDSTTLPITISQAALNGTFAKEQCGTWASENGEKQLNITLDNILFGDEYAENIVKGNNGEYTFSVDGETYSIKFGDEAITFTDNGESTLLYNCPWYMYIGDFYQNKVDVTIRANGIKVQFVGSAEQIASDIKFELVYLMDEYGDGDYGYQFSFKLGNTNYIMQQNGYDYDTLILASENDGNNGYGLYRDKYEELGNWEEYVGTYGGDNYTISIGNDKIVITQSQASTEIAKADITFYKDYSYEQGLEFYQFKVTYGGKECFIEPIEKAVVFSVPKVDSPSSQADYDVFYLMDTTYECDYSAFYGNYSGTMTYYDYYTYESDSYELSVTLEENGNVKVQIDEGNIAEGKVVYALEQNDSRIYLVIKMSDGTFYTCYVYPESEMYGYTYPQYLYVADENGYFGSLYLPE